MLDKIQEIETLIKRKSFTLAQKKATDYLKNLSINLGNKDFIIAFYLLLAEAYSKDIKNLKALEELEKINKTFPYEVKILTQIYDLALKLKRTTRVELALKELIEADLYNNEYLFKIVDFYILQEKYIEALGYLNLLATNLDDNIQVYTFFAFCYGKLGLITEQLETIRKLQQLEPNKITLFFEEVDLLFNQGSYLEAFELLNDLIEYYLENNKIDDLILTYLIYFSNYYFLLGYKSFFIRHIIRILASKEFNTLNKALKEKLLEILEEKQLTPLVGFLSKNTEAMKNYDTITIIENISYLVENKDLLTNFTIKELVNSNKVVSLVEKDFLPILYSLGI